MGYRIKTVSEITGIPKNTLVAWERRYGIVTPERRANGYRTYSERDLAVLLQVKEALAEGLKISEAVERVRRPRVVEEPPRPATSAFANPRAQLLEALLAFDRPRADALVRPLAGVPFQDLIDEVYMPLLAEVGELWAAGRATVAQEHHVSAFLRDRMTAMLLAVGSGPERGPHVACVTFPGDHHELAALALAVCLALAGSRVTYLGADLPAADLATYAREHRPVTVFVSVIMPVGVEALRAYARELRAAIGGATRLVIGGAGIPRDGVSVEGVDGVELHTDWHDLPLLAAATPRPAANG
ncbi:MAG: MerR family transcriptional regulator [Nannocystaceae bacterium]